MSKFGWSYPPGAASDPYAPYNQQEMPAEYITAQRNTRSIFREFGAKTWGDVYRALYKGTNCGVSVGVAFEGADRPMYCDDLYKCDMTYPAVMVLIGSIVEGVDQCCETVEVDLTKKGTSKTGNIIKRLFAAVQEVEDEAKSIWNDTHGCETCAKHWGCDGQTPVWTECPECKGHGIAI